MKLAICNGLPIYSIKALFYHHSLLPTGTRKFMARIGNLFIAGNEELNGQFCSGVAYTLATTPNTSYEYSTRDEKWQVHFTSESNHIVARSRLRLPFERAQSEGFSAIQEALDILSVTGVLSTYLHQPGSQNICVHCKDEMSALSVYSLVDLPIRMKLDIKSIDEDGNETEHKETPNPTWNESFRYFRLSQCSNDLFEAYRNLFLAFEALLNSICKKSKGESEGKWLQRALTFANTKSSLSQFAPTAQADAISHIIKTQYKDVRCKLQHAKFPSARLPHSNITPIDVKQAYGELVRIWRHIAAAYYQTSSGGGIVTHGGFAALMDSALAGQSSLHFTPDDSATKESDVLVSPKGLDTYQFEGYSYLGQVKPDIVRLVGFEYVREGQDRHKDPLYRLCSVAGSNLFAVTYMQAGLTVSGVDQWEFVHDIRLINSSQPKTDFHT